MTVETGPENDDGDPAWIRPALSDGGAYPGDEFHSYGRWKARIFPPKEHPLQADPTPMIRHGYRLSIERWNDVVKKLPADLGAEQADRFSPVDSPTALVLIAAHDVLEWIHSMHDFLRSRGVYGSALTPSEVDPESGGYVDGLLGARIALHHAFAQVLGLVDAPGPRYIASGDRWEIAGLSDQPGNLQARWAQDIPTIDSTRQRQAFIDHLSGRAVGDTFAMATHYFWNQMGTPTEPFVASGPADHPPPINSGAANA